MNPSVWQKTKGTTSSFSSPEKTVGKTKKFDVVIVGGGIFGVTAAYLLKRAGKKVCLLERDRIGSGETSRTTAHLNAFIDLRFTEQAKSFGDKAARQIWDSGAAAINLIDEIIKKEKIDCGFQRVPGYLQTALDPNKDEDNDVERLRKDYAVAQRLGIDCKWVEQSPVFHQRAIRFSNQAVFHPLKYVLALAQKIPGRGSVVLEKADVESVGDEPLQVEGKHFKIKCDYIIIATHVPIIGKNSLLSAMLFQTKIAPYSSYAIGAKVPRGTVSAMSLSDTSDPYYYLRVNRLGRNEYAILGGLDVKTGQGDDGEARYRQLEALLEKYIPAADVDRRWSGQVIESHDGLPFIGEISAKQFIATGFAGNGLTFSTFAALMARDAVLKKKNPWQDLYSPSRKEVRAGGLWDYFKENLDYPKYFVKDRLLSLDVGSVRSIKKGEGKVLLVDGKKLACSRDNRGKLHKVSAICTHMGCVVQWNGGEQTWDCPCHGSRFEPSGAVIGGPAEDPLETV